MPLSIAPAAGSMFSLLKVRCVWLYLSPAVRESSRCLQIYKHMSRMTGGRLDTSSYAEKKFQICLLDMGQSHSQPLSSNSSSLDEKSDLFLLLCIFFPFDRQQNSAEEKKETQFHLFFFSLLEEKNGISSLC